MKTDRWHKQRLCDAVAQSISYSETLRNLGIPVAGNNAATLKKKIGQYGIDISHFTFAPRKRQSRHPFAFHLTPNSQINRHRLKQGLLGFGYKRNVCEVCGISEWNGRQLAMQIHHKDGDPTNNSLENLMMICPNCHAQTENYRGLAKRPVENGQAQCVDCGRRISLKASRCASCAAKHRRHKAPKITITSEEFAQYKQDGYSNVRIAQMCGVTEAAIRKWIKTRNLS